MTSFWSIRCMFRIIFTLSPRKAKHDSGLISLKSVHQFKTKNPDINPDLRISEYQMQSGSGRSWCLSELVIMQHRNQYPSQRDRYHRGKPQGVLRNVQAVKKEVFIKIWCHFYKASLCYSTTPFNGYLPFKVKQHECRKLTICPHRVKLYLVV